MKMKRGVDYIGVGVGSAIVSRDRKLFLGLRGPASQNEVGKWEIPGGAVEFGETLQDALLREVQEEYGIKVAVLELLGICDHLMPSEKQHWVSPTYICKIIEGVPTIREPEKCEAIGWYSLSEAEKLPLSLVTQQDIVTLRKKYPEGLPDLYTSTEEKR